LVHGKRARSFKSRHRGRISNVAKADLGSKQLCPNCGAKFYDLNRRPAICPKCETSFDPDDDTVKATKARLKTKVAPATIDESEPGDSDEDDVVAARPLGEAGDGEDYEDPETAKELGSDDGVVIDPVEDDEADETPAGAVPAGFSEEGVDDSEDDVVIDDSDEAFDLDDDSNIDLEPEISSESDDDKT
jgi:uncharacterized protein (TIGR02300 family)